jgi:hypothetical protein
MSEESVRARNVAAVEALYEAERQRDITAWAALWSPLGRHTFWFSSPTPPVVGQADLVATTQRKFDVRPPYGIGVTVEPLADPSRVLARLHLTHTEPDSRTVDIWCLFHFDDEGLITEIEEILDTADAPAFPQ